MPNATPRRHYLSSALMLSCAAASFAGTDPWAPPAGHYDATTGTGATLKSQLYDRMRIPHFQRTYGEFRQSAALHDTDPNNPSNILLGYNRASVSATWNQGATWNREHVWPQSLQPGSASNGVRGNLGDPHALKPLNPSINSSRGNKPFAFGDTIGAFRSLGTFYFVGEEDRGDVARSLFYSETRYGPELGITLVNGAPGSNQMGDLESLIEWNYLDPPDTFERRRNHIIATQADNPFYFTNNRNAFIDRPQYVWSVYVDQSNDSRLFVGAGADANGASTLMLSAGSVFTGAPVPAPTPFMVSRDGDDGTYFSIAPMSGATSPQEFTANAFAINGPDTHAAAIGFDASATITAGFKAASAVIDNLDVTTSGGTGRGANDANDIVVLDLLVFDRAEASFDEFADNNTIVIDLGEIALDQGEPATEILIFNIGGPADLVAGLDVVFENATGDDDRFETDLTGEENDVSILDPLPVIISMRDDIPGSFAAEFTYRVYDDRTIPGFTEGTPLTIQVSGSVAIGACAGDLDSSSTVDSADLATLLSGWGLPGSTDLNNDGTTDSADLAILLSSWGSCAK